MNEPRKQNVTQGYYKQINDEWHKRCTGPAHEVPVYLPATEKYFYTDKRKGLSTKCRLCRLAKYANVSLTTGYVEVNKVRPFYIEAVNRIGLTELARRSGVSDRTISKVLHGKTRYVQKEKLRPIMLELVSIQRKNEFSASPHAQRHNQRRAAGLDAKFCKECRRPIWNHDGPIDQYTEGCNLCTDRRIGKDKRRRAKELTETD